jgi:hypothetical protein
VAFGDRRDGFMVEIAPRFRVDFMGVPGKPIGPRLPFAFAFALGDNPAPAASIPSGEVVDVAVHDGTRPTVDRHDWFAARLPGAPAVTGPLTLPGLLPGDRIEVEVLSVATEAPTSTGPLRVTLAIAGSGPAGEQGPVRVLVPANSAVRLKARRAGGWLSIGPVLARCPEGGDWRTVSARVGIRCTGR